MIEEVADLRIVSDELWAAVKATPERDPRRGGGDQGACDPVLGAPFHEAVNRQRREEIAARAGKERELAEVTRKLDKLIEAAIEGYRTAGLQQRLEELEARKAALEQKLAAAGRLHPNLARVYRGRSSGCTWRWTDPGLPDEALSIVRRLIERVVVHPGDDDPQIERGARS